MRKPISSLTCLCSAFKKIHLIDKCLIAFMSILLLQSAYSLFFHQQNSSEIMNIDIIVRSSAAAIFGYFLSVNFIRHTNPSEVILPDNIETEESTAPSCNTMQTTPILNTENTIPKIPQKTTNTQNNSSANRLQIICATAMGLFCLLSLLLLRNLAQRGIYTADADSIAATVTQFRDFISGCVGFLIGCPTNGDPTNK